MSEGTDNLTRKFELGIVGVVALVMLRVGIGWHFYNEGMWKYNHPQEASAANYFRNAKGPFAESYRSMVPDLEGRFRLNQEWFTRHLADLHSQAQSHYVLLEDQQPLAQTFLIMRQQQADQLFKENAQDIAFYLQDMDRLKAYAESDQAQEIPFEQERIWKKRNELLDTAGVWLDQLDGIEQGLRDDLILMFTVRDTDDEDLAAYKRWQQSVGPIPVERTTLQTIDEVTCFVVILIGFCLMVGLFTRIAAVAGAGFLMLVIMAMPALPNLYPPVHPSAGHAMLINKEVIEMIGLLVLACTHVGRWGGLDFFIYHLLIRPFYGTKVVTS